MCAYVPLLSSSRLLARCSIMMADWRRERRSAHSSAPCCEEKEKRAKEGRSKEACLPARVLRQELLELLGNERRGRWPVEGGAGSFLLQKQWRRKGDWNFPTSGADCRVVGIGIPEGVGYPFPPSLPAPGTSPAWALGTVPFQPSSSVPAPAPAGRRRELACGHDSLDTTRRRDARRRRWCRACILVRRS